MSDPTSQSPTSTPQSVPSWARPGQGVEAHLLRDIRGVKRRLAEEATNVVAMLEAALAALWSLDTAKAGEILQYDDRIDSEEVAIEDACFRVMALQAPVARDFRMLTFIIKSNSHIERVADHACALAKVTFKLADDPPRAWPTALKEMGDRVPIVCHALLRAMHDENPDAAREIVTGDKTIDRLNRQLFEELIESMNSGTVSNRTGLLVFRLGRELERVGDLMANIAEEIVYLATGEIYRHAKKRLRAEQPPGAQ